MKKLNSKGFTTIEVILCFVLVVIITTSIYTTITSFNQKRITEEYKSKMYTYKNLLTKEIQDDILKKGLVSVDLSNTTNDPDATGKEYKKIIFNFRDGSSKTLLVIWRHGKSDYHVFGDLADDYYMIKYGSGSEDDKLMKYPLPELGEYKYKVDGEPPIELTIKDLSINNVYCTTENNVLELHIYLYHQDLGYRYSINIVSPINYIDSGSNQENDI